MKRLCHCLCCNADLADCTAVPSLHVRALFLMMLLFAVLQVLQDEVPLPLPGSVSEQCRDFLAACLSKDPAKRPPAAMLLSHPWIAQAAPVNLKAFMGQLSYDLSDRSVGQQPSPSGIQSVRYILFLQDLCDLCGGGTTKQSFPVPDRSTTSCCTTTHATRTTGNGGSRHEHWWEAALVLNTVHSFCNPSVCMKPVACDTRDWRLVAPPPPNRHDHPYVPLSRAWHNRHAMGLCACLQA